MEPNMYPIRRKAATNTLHAALILKATVENQLQERTGLLLADNEALLNLAATDKPMRTSDVAERLILSPGGTTKVIDRLEAKGYVKRLPQPGDRRATILEITHAGQHIMAHARAVIDEQLKEIWAKHITDEEAAVIVAVTERVINDQTGP